MITMKEIISELLANYVVSKKTLNGVRYVYIKLDEKTMNYLKQELEVQIGFNEFELQKTDGGDFSTEYSDGARLGLKMFLTEMETHSAMNTYMNTLFTYKSNDIKTYLDSIFTPDTYCDSNFFNGLGDFHDYVNNVDENNIVFIR